jgi:hypothetical protein
MRPHNKSTLWDEYVEHPDKNKKYFNTKHKKAFCKRCIAKAVDDLDRSPDARVQFETTGFVEGWPEWKYRAGKQTKLKISINIIKICIVLSSR